ncbi:nucleotide disphospho-sugar-binding domain-containing protein [Granulicella sp. L60]|uniref:nucleotide disphospho-sugar-binding domain-containing protein n=1 Tax=Granulicella sp. L60 TaxID=1641866 RepID=UPI00131BE026|nr:nucleotide disphospho-sugar-binding domain-containing protein [Granulicella sp. L60]
MKIAFVGLKLPDYLPPMITLARKLQERGQNVAFISVVDAEMMVRAAGLSFIPFCQEQCSLGTSDKVINELRHLEGAEMLNFSVRTYSQTLDAAMTDLPRVLKESAATGVVLDTALIGLGLVPMHLGMPYVHVSTDLHYDFSGITPLSIFSWGHESTIEAVERNRGALKSLAKVFEPAKAVVQRYAEAAGMDLDWSDPWVTISKLAWISQTRLEFDFKSTHLPQQFHYTGPFDDGLSSSETEFPWESLTGDPLIYGCMGSMQKDAEHIFNLIAKAVGDREGLQLVLCIGLTLEVEKIESLPANAIVVRQAPQSALLRRSALCIAHGQLNSVLESLAHGVPVVAIPRMHDQPGVAARIAYTKTGVFIPAQEITSLILRSLIDEVLNNPEYRINAVRMKEAIAEARGLDKAANLLVHAFDLEGSICTGKIPCVNARSRTHLALHNYSSATEGEGTTFDC